MNRRYASQPNWDESMYKLIELAATYVSESEVFHLIFIFFKLLLFFPVLLYLPKLGANIRITRFHSR